MWDVWCRRRAYAKVELITLRSWYQGGEVGHDRVVQLLFLGSSWFYFGPDLIYPFGPKSFVRNQLIGFWVHLQWRIQLYTRVATLVARAKEGAKWKTKAKNPIGSASLLFHDCSLRYPKSQSSRLCLFKFALYDGTGPSASSISPILANPWWVLHFFALAPLSFIINLGS